MAFSARQPADGAGGTAAELFSFHAHALGKWDEEVGKGSIIVRIVGDVVTVFIAPASEQNGQVAPTV